MRPDFYRRIPRRQYIGQLATRCRLPGDQQFTSALTATIRSYHYARDNITTLSVGHGAWFVTAGTGEVNASAGTTIRGSIEYPAGVFHQLLWGGASSVTIAAGATLFSDYLQVAIPDGAKFFVRRYYSGSALPFFDSAGSNATWLDTTGGDAFMTTASDLTMSGTLTDDGTGDFLCPCAIIGPTYNPTVAAIGDSRTMGWGDTVVANVGDSGEVLRSLGPYLGYINMGVGSEKLASVVATLGTNSPKRRALMAYCTHIVNELGAADIFDNGVSAATTEANLLALYCLPGLVGKPIFQQTFQPKSTGTFATTGAQTTVATNSVRVAVNNWIKSDVPPIEGYHDTCVAVEFTPASGTGVWNAPGYTADGTHATATGYTAIVTQGLVNPARFILM